MSDTSCGTYAGYQRHYAAGEPADQACREARNAYVRWLRRQHKGTSDRMSTEIQGYTLRVLHGRLGRPVPELAGLTFEEAGDLIISLREEMVKAGASA